MPLPPSFCWNITHGSCPGDGWPSECSRESAWSPQGLYGRCFPCLPFCSRSSQLLGLVSGANARVTFLFAFWVVLVSAIKKEVPAGSRLVPVSLLPITVHSTGDQLRPLYSTDYWLLASVSEWWALPSSNPCRVSLHRILSWNDATGERQMPVGGGHRGRQRKTKKSAWSHRQTEGWCTRHGGWGGRGRGWSHGPVFFLSRLTESGLGQASGISCCCPLAL